MSHSLLLYLFLFIDIIYMINGQVTSIDGIWYDDFEFDNQGKTYGITGWDIYNSETNYSIPNNPIIFGENGKKYHGPITKMSDSSEGNKNWFRREFECGITGQNWVNVYYKFAWCQTIDDTAGVWLRLCNIEGTCDFNAEIKRPENGLPLNDTILANNAYDSCNGTWYYQSVIKQKFQEFNANNGFPINMRLQIGKYSMYMLLFDISIECKLPPTSAPSDHPTLSPTTFPSHYPTKIPTETPTKYETTSIYGIWYDDFEIDETDKYGVVGWHIYNSGFNYSTPNNPIIFGENGKEYHGAITKMSDSSEGNKNWFRRYFKCGEIGQNWVNVYYKFAWCQTIDDTAGVWLRLCNTDGTCDYNAEIKRPENGLPLNDTILANNAYTICNGSWYYQSVIKQKFQKFNANNDFPVTMRLQIGKYSMYMLLFDIAIECKLPPTQNPSDQPTVNPTKPSNAPTQYPSDHPTMDFVVNVSVNSTVGPQVTVNTSSGIKLYPSILCIVFCVLLPIIIYY